MKSKFETAYNKGFLAVMAAYIAYILYGTIKGALNLPLESIMLILFFTLVLLIKHKNKLEGAIEKYAAQLNRFAAKTSNSKINEENNNEI